MTLGKLIKLYRSVYALDIRTAAKMIGVSPATLSRIEHGKAVDQKTIVLLLLWLFESK